MKLLSYQPDADPTQDGVITNCSAVIPTYRGIGNARSPSDTLNSAVAATVLGAASLLKLDGTSRTFAGTSTKLYELSSGSWTDRSSGGGSYTAVANRWRFAQYGDISIAASKTNVTQYSTTGAFADVVKSAVNAPKADIVEVVNNFVFLCNTNAGPSPYNADATNRWFCSAIGDYTDWTPSVATQCTTGLLTSTPGPITAAKRFGDQIIIYKRKGMYVGSYVGAPVVWAFQEIPSAAVGTWCQESVCSVGTPEQPLHFFVGPDDFYVFDGTRSMSVGNGVREQFFNTLNITHADQICLTQNRSRTLVYVYYPSGSSSTCNACLVYNYRTKKWGVHDLSIEYAFEYINPGVTYDSLGTYYSTYGDFPNSPYDTAFVGADTILPAVFETDHKLYTLSGSGTTSTVTTGDLGSDMTVTNVSRVTPRFTTLPSTASLVNYYRDASGNTLTSDQSVTMSSGRFDFLRSAPWHRFVFTFSGDWELSDVNVSARQDGLE